MNIWQIFLYQPLINILIFMYQALGSNLGVAIIGTTILVRLALIPLTMPGMKSAQKMQELKPELDKLKQKYGNDKQGLAQGQIDLYKKHNINPFGSLLPTILQFLLLIALFQVFTTALKPGADINSLNSVLYNFVKLPESTQINTQFFYLDVTKQDVFSLPSPINLGPISIPSIPGLFLIGAVLVQFLSSKVMMVDIGKSVNKNDKKKNGSSEDMMMSMQKQMMIVGPLMTLIIGINFPSGMVLYWFVISLTMIFQQWYMQNKKLTIIKVTKTPNNQQ